MATPSNVQLATPTYRGMYFTIQVIGKPDYRWQPHLSDNTKIGTIAQMEKFIIDNLIIELKLKAMEELRRLTSLW